jgi:HNH endonuclease
MTKPYISNAIRQLVAERAGRCCEYCKSPADYTTDPFSIEHILPLCKNGLNELINLAFSCLGCNGYKGIKIEFRDPATRLTFPLFNPRTMEWNDHFMWDETFTVIVGKTPVGRATITGLKLNRQEVKNLRFALVSIGIHPPK